MWERAIIHSDINHCYAQIEEMLHPELRNVPMVVGGHEEERHGIILAKNDLAKQYDIKTGESLREAKAKCPFLTIVHPHYDEYIYYTSQVKNIYREYSNRVESFGLDEAWIDISDAQKLFGDPLSITQTIQKRVLDEIGLTVSCGLSYNKVFAKLGSDLIKPYGLTVISKENYKDVIYDLPIGDLFYVGRQTQKKLLNRGISTIGLLASLKVDYLTNFLGKMGEVLWYFANGLDVSEVALNGYSEDPKSIGNGFTTVKDITNLEEAKLVFYVLTESVASRLKDANMKGSVISISLRNSNLEGFTRQKKINVPTNITEEIMPHVLLLLKDNYDFSNPLRAINVTVSKLEPDNTFTQLNMFVDENKRIEAKNLELSIDTIRNKYGFESIKRCCLLLDEELTHFNPKGDNIIYPVGYF